MMKGVSVPLYYMPAWTDPPSLRPGGHYIQLLNENGGKGSKSLLFRNQVHGWANRGDIRDPKVKVDVERFMDETLAFFKEHISGEIESEL